jgi:broad specificity phosphatase PhoE
MTKRLLIVRHGQASHNPRAEVAKDAGCTHAEFLEIMRQDDVLDAPTTDLGKEQARALRDQHSWDHVDLVVSSPLSRALETADVIAPPNIKRVCVEDFREINGWLLNAQRRNRSHLEESFPLWNFSETSISETDELWTPNLEDQIDCAHRGYEGLCWLMNRPEENILLVCHGGILRFTMSDHPNVRVVDGRVESSRDRDVKARFRNCELRSYTLRWDADDDTLPNNNGKPIITLTEQD